MRQNWNVAGITMLQAAGTTFVSKNVCRSALTEPGSFYYSILQVKLHYFTGVVLRLDTPCEYPESLIGQALAAEQKKHCNWGSMLCLYTMSWVFCAA